MIQKDNKYLGNLGDADPIEHGGLFVYVDENGRAQAEKVVKFDDFELAEEEDLVNMIIDMAHAVAEKWVEQSNNVLVDNEEFEALKEMLGEYFEDKFGKWEIRRFDIDRCTFINGVLSDNKFHPEHSAWWANPENKREEYVVLGDIASYVGEPIGDLLQAFCSDDPLVRARAYESLGDYHGFDNLDSDPLIIYSLKEMEDRYKEELKLDKERKNERPTESGEPD